MTLTLHSLQPRRGDAIAVALTVLCVFAPGSIPAAAAQDAASAPAPAAPATPATAVAGPPPGPDALASLSWLRGCWNGKVNQREFNEQWLPQAGGMMVGANQTVMQGRTQDYGYLRLEVRGDGVFYVATPSGEKESAFRLSAVSRDEINPADIFTFSSLGEGFPARIVYRHGAEGWLYAQIEGQLNGEDRKVVYPMRHVDCLSGEMLHK